MNKADLDSAGPSMPAPDATIMPGVVPRASCPGSQASVRQQAIESIGMYEWQDFTDATFEQGSRLVNQRRLLDSPRDLACAATSRFHLEGVPLDLDQDGTVDTHVTRDISLKGASSAIPRFRTGRRSRRPTGNSATLGQHGIFRPARRSRFPHRQTHREIGMTCWLCHSGRNPVDGKTVLGLQARASTTA